MSALAIMLEAGFNFSVKGKDLLVSPISKLTNEQREFIKQHKPQIIKELASQTQESLSPINRAAILRWLNFIGENNQEIIDDVLEYCRTNPEGLTYYLDRSKEVDRYTQAIKQDEAAA